MEVSKTDLRKTVSLLEYAAQFIDLHYTKHTHREKGRQCKLLANKIKRKLNGNNR